MGRYINPSTMFGVVVVVVVVLVLAVVMMVVLVMVMMVLVMVMMVVHGFVIWWRPSALVVLQKGVCGHRFFKNEGCGAPYRVLYIARYFFY